MPTTDEADIAATAVASSEKDDAIAMVGEEKHAIDPAVEARVVRKIDMFLMPTMVLGCVYKRNPPLSRRQRTRNRC